VDVGDETVSFTVSVGVTRVRAGDKTVEAVLNRADEALYKAKRMGRNRVVRG
jgi:diguanylate cyclase (GGDEF)-like protein